MGLETEAAAEDLRSQHDAAAELDGAAAETTRSTSITPSVSTEPGIGGGPAGMLRRRADGRGR
ncbi:MAG TPA: hypothetical protein VIT42_08440 [Microlunatus sp.]